MSKSLAKKIKKDLVKGDLNQMQIARKYSVSRSYVWSIKNEKTHKDVPWPGDQAPIHKRKLPKHDPTNERIVELEAEVEMLREERNHARQAAKASSKQRGLWQAAVEVIEERVTPFRPLPSARKVRKSNVVKEDVVLHLSDGHHDQVVRSEETGGLEEYNFPISCARAEKFVSTALEHTQEHLSNYDFQNLYILAYGDHTSGEIHGHEKRSYFRNQMKNTLAIGQLHALMFRDLAPFFETVQCVYVPGNHGRRTTKKDHYGAHENWDYMVAKTAELHCQDLDNVHFVIPNAFSCALDIRGHGFQVAHGDDIRSSLGIPFYGMVRRQKSLMGLNNITGGLRIRYLCMGHHHVLSSLADLDGELIVNGAWLGTDQYAFNSFAGYREPVQLMHGVHDRWGASWRLPIYLKTDREKSGPERYFVEMD